MLAQPFSASADQSPASWLADAGQTRAVLDEYGLRTKHRLGQNFLVSDTVIRRILDLAGLDADDVVLEVGPGIGTLTVALLDHAGAVCAIEADRALPKVLQATCAPATDRLAIIEGDALRITPSQIKEALGGLGDLQKDLPTKLVSNLPYQVAARVVLRTFHLLPTIERVVVMVQVEVADRMAAAPGTRDYSAYTAKLALLACVDGRFEVGRGCFMPAPHVDSAVIRLERKPLGDPATGRVLSERELAQTARVIDAAFAQRRKTLRNSMVSSGFAREELDAALAAADVDGSRRAETFAPEDFVRLTAAWEQLRA